MSIFWINLWKKAVPKNRKYAQHLFLAEGETEVRLSGSSENLFIVYATCNSDSHPGIMSCRASTGICSESDISQALTTTSF